MDTPQVLLDHHLKTLRLPTFLREYDKVAKKTRLRLPMKWSTFSPPQWSSFTPPLTFIAFWK